MKKIVIDIENVDWKDKNTLLVFLYMLANADENGVLEVTIPMLEKALSMTTKQVRLCLEKLEKGSQTAVKRAVKNRVITICNYASYLLPENTEGQSKGQSKGSLEGTGAGRRAVKRAVKESLELPVNTRGDEGLENGKGQSKGQSAGQSTNYNIIINNYIDKYSLEIIYKIVGEENIALERDIDLRKLKFWDDLQAYTEEFTEPLVKKFFYYWSEYNRSQTKMRMETEKTWELKRRLAKWRKNQKDWTFEKQAQTLATGQARSDENADTIIKKANF